MPNILLRLSRNVHQAFGRRSAPLCRRAFFSRRGPLGFFPRRMFNSHRLSPWPRQSYVGRAMDDHFRDMEKMVDGVFGHRFWERSSVVGKEISVSIGY